MFEKTIDEIFTINNLKYTLDFYKKDKDFEIVKKDIESGKLLNNLKNNYKPKTPKKYIIKNNNKQRELISNHLETKVIQKTLLNQLDKDIKLSDRCYAFRKNKSTNKAISRAKHILKTNHHILKIDIEKFFDNINIDILYNKLNNIIKSKDVLSLIYTFIINGSLQNSKWIDKERGVYQGDNLSPLFANIYLDEFDKMLEKDGIEFIRYSDDIIIFSKYKNKLIDIENKIIKYLSTISLSLNNSKRVIADRYNGFEYLGIYIKKDTIYLSQKQINDKYDKFVETNTSLSIDTIIKNVNNYILIFERFYKNILTDYSRDLEKIQNRLLSFIKDTAIKLKEKGFFTNKKDIADCLDKIDFLGEMKDKYIQIMLSEIYLITKDSIKKENTKKIEKIKQQYIKDGIKSSEIVATKFGLYIGYSKGKIQLKEYGKIIKSAPINSITRIIILNKGISISTSLIIECVNKKIDIDLIYKNNPYAMITKYKSPYNELHIKQLNIITNQERKLDFAKEIVHTKSKNQINLLKYYNRYRKKSDINLYEKIKKEIDNMNDMNKKINKKNTIESLMGLEGVISSRYWGVFGMLIGIEKFERVTYNAYDEVNQALNYGYGFLYNRIQTHLIKKGININLSFLHSQHRDKPTLVFDIIEEFRQPIVDREIISIINLGSKISTTQGKLTKDSTKIITQNIQERLSTKSEYKGIKTSIANIIENQINNLYNYIETNNKYNGYIAKY